MEKIEQVFEPGLPIEKQAIAFIARVVGVLQSSSANTDGTRPFWSIRDKLGKSLIDHGVAILTRMTDIRVRIVEPEKE